MKLLNLLVSTVARNSGNYNLIGHAGVMTTWLYICTCTNCNPIIAISISLSCQIDLQRSIINI